MVIGAQALIGSLTGAGVDVCFMNPGTSEMHFVSALDSVPKMRGVLALFEGVATGQNGQPQTYLVSKGVYRDKDGRSLGVYGISEVAAGLLERGFLVHGDDRKATALAHTGVLDHGAAQGLDQLLEVMVAGVLVIDP